MIFLYIATILMIVLFLYLIYKKPIFFFEKSISNVKKNKYLLNNSFYLEELNLNFGLVSRNSFMIIKEGNLIVTVEIIGEIVDLGTIFDSTRILFVLYKNTGNAYINLYGVEGDKVFIKSVLPLKIFDWDIEKIVPLKRTAVLLLCKIISINGITASQIVKYDFEDVVQPRINIIL